MTDTPLLAFYGDDFTGSTDAMEVLAAHGVDTLLFLAPPDDATLAQARRRHAAIGFAGTSRAQDPTWMDRELPAVFARMARCGAPIVHYKVCSTFDSSPTVGSIGRATEIGRRVLRQQRSSPLVVGAPPMRRFTAFGQLFAAAGETVHRIDRHPTMSRHPVTPMDEADLRLHLARQTELPVGLLDLGAQQLPDADARYEALAARHPITMIDVWDAGSQARAGRLMWRAAAQRGEREGPLVAIGSSGVEYALVSHWAGLWPEQVHAMPGKLAATGRIAVLSGSCSPATAGQIRHAVDAGFVDLRADVRALVQEDRCEAELQRLHAAAMRALEEGRSPLVYTASGPDDPAVSGLREFMAAHRLGREVLARMGQRLGAWLARLIREAWLERVVVSGGDTSGDVVQALGLQSLRYAARLTPGAPLCIAEDGQGGRLQIALKGGQMGGPDYFVAARQGGG